MKLKAGDTFPAKVFESVAGKSIKVPRPAITMRTSAILVAVLISPVAFSQTTSVSVGVIGGTHVTDSFGMSTSTIATPSVTGIEVSTTGPRSLIIGPTLEVKLPWRFSFEVDALHRNLQTTLQLISQTPGVPNSPKKSGTIESWEFPMLAKYRFSVAGVHPFVEGGPSYRPVGNGSVSRLGITAGTGIEFRAGKLGISPTVRYTHWDHSFTSPPEKSDQVELLVGFDLSGDSTRASVLGRRLSVGALVGAGLGDNFHPATSPIAVQHPDSNSIVAGLLAEVGLGGLFSIEADGLYRPLHGTSVPSAAASPDDHPVRFATLTWEFPVLAKYRFSIAKAKPFIEAGPSFRAIGNIEIVPPSKYGVTAGAGVEFVMRRLKVAPTFRYTRWAADGSTDPAAAHAFQSETQLLLGISF